jgi:hypothetical protein
VANHGLLFKSSKIHVSNGRDASIRNDLARAILEWSDPLGLRGCGFFHILDEKIAFQRGYWDKLSFLRLHGLPLPKS